MIRINQYKISLMILKTLATMIQKTLVNQKVMLTKMTKTIVHVLHRQIRQIMSKAIIQLKVIISKPIKIMLIS